MDDTEPLAHSTTPPAEPSAPPADPLAVRLLRLPPVRLVLGLVIIIAAWIAPLVIAKKIWPHRPSDAITCAVMVVAAAIIIGAWKLYKRFIERAEDSELAFAGGAREVALGFGGGFALFSAMVAVVAALGGMSVLGVNGVGKLWLMIGVAVFSGTSEEILFRGIIMRNLEEMVGTWGALALTSAFFGAAHLHNPDATWFAAVAIALEAGILLGATYLYTRRLWAAMGLHAGWNFTQGWVFSAPVSGSKIPEGLLLTSRQGPEWLTGGGFGLEASAVAMVVATLAGCVLLWRVWQRGGFVAAPWMRGKV